MGLLLLSMWFDESDCRKRKFSKLGHWMIRSSLQEALLMDYYECILTYVPYSVALWVELEHFQTQFSTLTTTPIESDVIWSTTRWEAFLEWFRFHIIRPIHQWNASSVHRWLSTCFNDILSCGISCNNFFSMFLLSLYFSSF